MKHFTITNSWYVLIKMVKPMQKTTFFQWKWASILLAVGLMASACKKDAPAEPIDPEFDFRLRVVNDRGIETNTFKQGENFWLSLIITNKIKEARFVSPDDFGNMRTLFRVTRLSDSTDWGQAWQNMICIGRRRRLEGQQSFELKLPWRSDTAYFNFCLEHVNKPVLPSGSYQTRLREYVTVGTLEENRLTKKLDLVTNFNIQ
jgi:hypothetical protein